MHFLSLIGVKGLNGSTATVMKVTFSVEFSSMSESIKTSQVDLSVKRCSCVVLFPYKQAEMTWHTQAYTLPPPPPPCTMLARHEISILPKRIEKSDQHQLGRQG